MAELILSVTVPDEKVPEIVDGLARQNGWTEYVLDENDELVPNPVTKGQWIRDWILNVVRESWRAWNNAQAVKAALEDQDEDGSDFS